MSDAAIIDSYWQFLLDIGDLLVYNVQSNKGSETESKNKI